MDFNRYISTGEFAALADWFRSDGEVVHYAAGDRFARQGCRNRHCGVVGRGAFRYVHLARSGERHVPLPESSWAIMSRCAAIGRRR